MTRTYHRDSKTHISSVIKILMFLSPVVKRCLSMWIYGWMTSFNELLFPIYKEFYSSLTMESVTDAVYKHAERVWEDFVIQNVCQYNDLYIKRDTLLLAKIFESLTNNWLEICKLDLASFISAPGLTLQTCWKKTKIKLEVLTDTDM